MSYALLSQSAIMEVPNLRSLRAFYESTGGPVSPIGQFVITGKPLSEAQRKALPEDLRRRVA